MCFSCFLLFLFFAIDCVALLLFSENECNNMKMEAKWDECKVLTVNKDTVNIAVFIWHVSHAANTVTCIVGKASPGQQKCPVTVPKIVHQIFSFRKENPELFFLQRRNFTNYLYCLPTCSLLKETTLQLPEGDERRYLYTLWNFGPLGKCFVPSKH